LSFFSLGERKIQVIKGDFEKLFSLGERTTQVVEGCFKLTFRFGTLDELDFVTMDLQFHKFLIQVRNAYCPLNSKIDHVGLLSHGISKSLTFMW
jgi:hypothetical protein